MKIMHIIDSGGFYGAEVMLLDLMAGQKKLGLHPLICSMGTPGAGEKEIERQARMRGLEVNTLRIHAGLNPYGIYRILRKARANQVDVLHSHGYKGNILAGCIPKAIRKIPLVCTLHGWTNTRRVSKMALYEWLDRRMLPSKDAVIVVNKLMLNNPRVTAANIPGENLYVVNNGIDPDLHIPDGQDSSDLGRIDDFTREGFIIGAIGRLSFEKGYAYLLEATALLHKEGHKVRLVIAGDGPLKDELRRTMISLGIEDIVLFTGYIANAWRCHRYFDVLAISSLSEGLPITLLEAMRAGTPVISTRVGGIPDVIDEGKTGMLVAPGNAQELRDAIRLIINDPGLSTSLIQQATIKLREHYSSNIMALNYLSIYKKLTCI